MNNSEAGLSLLGEWGEGKSSWGGAHNTQVRGDNRVTLELKRGRGLLRAGTSRFSDGW